MNLSNLPIPFDSLKNIYLSLMDEKSVRLSVSAKKALELSNDINNLGIFLQLIEKQTEEARAQERKEQENKVQEKEPIAEEEKKASNA